MVTYFFDTYALIESMRNSPSYARFLDESIITTKFNLAELLFIVLCERGEAAARDAFLKFKDAEADVPDEILFAAMVFRNKNKKKGLSYTDCIGYTYAVEHGLLFLTGDDAFKDMPRVEFVK